MNRIGRLLAASAICAGTGASAVAATLRQHVSLHGPTVRLSDLFDGLLPGQDCALGPAPSAGKPLLLPPSQLAAIASQFGVDWHQTTGYESISLERPARLLRRDEVLAVLAPALLQDGMPPDSTIGLGVFSSLSIPADASPLGEIRTLDYDPQTGRFAATVQFALGDTDAPTIRVAGQTGQAVSVLAPKHGIAAGSTLGSDDVMIARFPKAALRGTPVSDVSLLAGMVTRQALAAGSPLLLEQFARPLSVARGRPIVLRLSGGGLALTATGTALEAGGAGDRIHVLNNSSHAILVGQIVDAADVQIDPGTEPLFVPQPGSAGYAAPSGFGSASAQAMRPVFAQEAHTP